jgi:hypothetical protein
VEDVLASANQHTQGLRKDWRNTTGNTNIPW